MKKKLLGFLLSAAMVVTSVMPVMAANRIIPLTLGKWQEFISDYDSPYYMFNIPDSGTVKVSVEGARFWYGVSIKADDSTIDSDMGVTSENGVIIYEGNYEVVGGKYYICPDARYNDGGQKFRIRVNFKSAEESFPEMIGDQNNSDSTACDIVLNKSYDGQLAYNDTADFFKFTALQKGKYRINYSYLINMSRIRIQDDWGKVFLDEELYAESSDAATDYTNELALPEGDYYFIVEKPVNSDRDDNNGNYSFTIKGNTKVVKKPISKVTAEALTYTGKLLSPKVDVEDANGNILVKGTDYTVSYKPSTMKAVGAYKATVKGKGDYTGTSTVSFKVNPKGTSISSLKAASKSISVSIKPQTTEMDGYYIQYSTDKTFKKNVVKKTVNKDASNYRISKLLGGKKYYVRIATYKKVAGKTYTSNWSGVKYTTTKK